MQEYIEKAGVLIEAIPYIHAFRRKVFVIKYGGSILSDETIRKNVLSDIVFLSYVGIRTILVHGGGPHISSRLKDSGIESKFQIVQEIKELKGDVTGLKGYENIIHVEKKQASQELGFVGTIKAIERQAIEEHLHNGHITVVSPMGISVEQQPHNINADEVASAIAISLQAEKLVLLTNVQGVMAQVNDQSSLQSSLQMKEIQGLIKNNVIQGGMIPKVNSCLEALNGGVHKAHIIDARLDHALLLEIFTDRGIGTQILKGQGV